MEDVCNTNTYIYTYSYHEDEKSLCMLEMRALFGLDTEFFTLRSSTRVDPSRSPFLNERVTIRFEEGNLEQLWAKLRKFTVADVSFKVIYVKHNDLANEDKLSFEERRKIERETGLQLNGRINLKEPDLLFGIMNVNGNWIFGELVQGESIWYKHQTKPHQYSTALSTRVARAVVNISVPNPEGLKVIDPCCGIGTVVIEALSMGIHIVGSDINYQVLPQTRENIAYLRYHTDIKLMDIRDITSHYDVAIIDMPYNLCSVLTTKEKQEMLQSARNFAAKVVVITVEPMDDILEKVGLRIVDRGIAKKASFIREVIVCK